MSENKVVDIHGFPAKAKETSKADVGKPARTPFKDIGSNQNQLKDKQGTPSKFEANRSLEDDESWRDRTEVVTKLEHTAYKVFARDMLEETIKTLAGVENVTPRTSAKSELLKMTFRDPTRSMNDSVMGMDDTIESCLDATLDIPPMNSTAIPTANITYSNPATPNRSDDALGNSLSGSFEKMNIKVSKEEESDDDADDFHDASEDFNTFSATPSKLAVSTKDPQLQADNTLDVLINSIEKIYLRDHEDSILEANSSSNIFSLGKELLAKGKNGDDIPVEGPVEQAVENPKDCPSIPAIKDDKKAYDFQDVDVNPFLIGTPTGKPLKDVIEPSSPISKATVDSTTDHKEAPDVVDANGTIEKPAVPPTTNDLQFLLNKPEETPTVDLHPKSKVLNSPRVEKLLNKKHNLETVESTLKVMPAETATVSKADSVPVSEKSNTVELSGEPSAAQSVYVNSSDILPQQLEKEDVLPPKNYDFEKVIMKINDPTFDPFISKSLVVNSPDIVPDGEKDHPDTLKDEIIPKSYSLESALQHIKNSDFDPFASQDLIVNSPNLTSADGNGKDSALPASTFSFDVAGTEVDLLATALAEPSSTPKESSVGDEIASVPSDELASPKSKGIPTDFVISPKRKYEEAFAKEEEDQEVEEEPADVSVLTLLNDAKGKSDGSVGLSSVLMEDPSVLPEGPEELSISAKKAYDLESLGALDDPNFNPFTTKSAVANTPDKDATTKFVKDEQVEGRKEDRLVQFEEEIIKNQVSDAAKVDQPKKEENIKEEEGGDCSAGGQNAQGSAVEATEKLPEVHNKESAAVQQLIAGDDQALDTFPQKQQDPEEEIIPPKKGYQLDFLDNLDDQNFDPFSTKASVSNSPNRETSDTKKISIIQSEEKLPVKKETSETPAVGKPKPGKIIPKLTLKKKVPSVVKPKMEESQMSCNDNQGEEEIPLPKKSYALDFLDDLDDPNFNPFATKTAVSNSPDKGSTGIIKSETEVLKKEDSSEMQSAHKVLVENEEKEEKLVKEEPAQAVDNMEKKAIEKPKPVKKNVKMTLKKKVPVAGKPKLQPKMEESQMSCNDNQEEEEIPLPKKSYALDFLDNLDDPNFNPFATKTAVSNSPDKGSTGIIKSETEVLKKEDSSEMKSAHKVLVENEEKEKIAKEEPAQAVDNMEKPKPVKKNVKITLKGKVPVAGKPKLQESVTKSNEGCNEEPVIPKKSKELDFFDKLDDPNFNPFATKAAVLNSPEKDKSVVLTKNDIQPEVEVNNEPIAEMVVSSSEVGTETVHMDDVCKETIGSDDVSSPETVIDEGKVITSTSSSLKDGKVTNGKESGDDAFESKKGYRLDILDHLDDPNFNPFASETMVVNTPEKGSPKMAVKAVEFESPKVSKYSEVTDEEKGQANRETCLPPMTESPIDRFNKITKEAMELVAEATPAKKRFGEKKILRMSLPKDPFSPVLAQSGKSQDDSGACNFEFMNATDFFNGPGDLDMLGEHGKDGDKLNLVRNSLYMKFDPLMSGRPSLAPYLAQQLLMGKEESQRKGENSLMCFSPSPDKTERGERLKGPGTPVRPLFTTRADETVIVNHENTTTNLTMLEEKTVCENHDATIAANCAASDFSTTILSHGGKFHDETVLHGSGNHEERMIPEHEVVKQIKEIEQRMEFVMQDKLLRQGRIFEELQKQTKQQADESEIVVASMEEENSALRAKIHKLETMMVKIVEEEKNKFKAHQREQLLQENKHDLMCKALKKEAVKYQEEMKKTEDMFYDLAKKYTRLQEVTELLRRNEEGLKGENEFLKANAAKKEEKFLKVLKVLEDKYTTAQQQFQEEKEKHEQEQNKLYVLVKKAEVKILSLTGTVEKKNSEIETLTKLVDDLTQKFG